MKSSILTNQLLTDISVATMAEGEAPYGLLKNAAIAIDGKNIAWVGSIEALPNKFSSWTVMPS